MRFTVWMLVALLGFATPSSGERLERAHPASAPGAGVGAEALAQINAYRGRNGRAALVPHAVLQALARQHSQHQASRTRLSHDGFRRRSARATAATLTRRCVENAGRGYRDARQLLAGWTRSSGHRRNLLQPYLRYGAVAVVGRFSTFLACG